MNQEQLKLYLFILACVVLGFVVINGFHLVDRLAEIRCQNRCENETILREHQLKVQELRQEYCFSICENLKYGFCEEEEGAYQNCLDDCLSEKVEKK